MMDFRELTMAFFLAVIADRRHITPRLSFTNVAALNYLLRSEIFVSKDQQLRAVHLILDFEPISRTFQEIGHAIRAGDPRNKPYRRIQARFLSSRRSSSRHTSHSANPSFARNSLATSTSWSTSCSRRGNWIFLAILEGGNRSISLCGRCRTVREASGYFRFRDWIC